MLSMALFFRLESVLLVLLVQYHITIIVRVVKITYLASTKSSDGLWKVSYYYGLLLYIHIRQLNRKDFDGKIIKYIS